MGCTPSYVHLTLGVHLGVHGYCALLCVFMIVLDNKKARLYAGLLVFSVFVIALKYLLNILNLLAHLLDQHFQLDG